MFDNYVIPFSTPDALSFEHFLPWIHKIMLAYQEPDKPEEVPSRPEGIRYSKAYYTKKFNPKKG